MMEIGFIGAGKIAQALAKGFITAGITKSECITASCISDDVLSIEAFKSLGGRVTSDNREIVRNNKVVFVATKPDVVPVVLRDIREELTDDHLLVSLAMGVTISSMEKLLPEGVALMRVMSNTGAEVGKAASAVAPGPRVRPHHTRLVERLLRALGTAHTLPEPLFDPVTALTGSGPAYVYTMIESLGEGGVRMGLPRDVSYSLAGQVVAGAGEMYLASRLHPAHLRGNVTSPAGSTAEGLFCLEEGGFRSSIIRAIEKGTKKCKEVSAKLEESFENENKFKDEK